MKKLLILSGIATALLFVFRKAPENDLAAIAERDLAK